MTVPALTEAQFQQQVVQLARLRGWWIFHDHDSRRNAAGWPDLVLLRERVVYVELKTERGRVRPAQTEVHDRLRAAGAEVWLWRPADWGVVQEVLAPVRAASRHAVRGEAP